MMGASRRARANGPPTPSSLRAARTMPAVIACSGAMKRAREEPIRRLAPSLVPPCSTSPGWPSACFYGSGKRDLLPWNMAAGILRFRRGGGAPSVIWMVVKLFLPKAISPSATTPWHFELLRLMKKGGKQACYYLEREAITKVRPKWSRRHGPGVAWPDNDPDYDPDVIIGAVILLEVGS